MKNGDIPDGSIHAISFRNANTIPTNGRLDGSGQWSADGSISNPWIQADIGYQTYVSGVVTQGCGNNAYSCWITKIQVSTFTSESSLEAFIEDPATGGAKVCSY